MLVVKSLDPLVPNRVLIYGQFSWFGNTTGSMQTDLDYEQKENDLTSYIGNAGLIPTYCKCGETECDVYLGIPDNGRLVVQYLFSVDPNGFHKRGIYFSKH